MNTTITRLCGVCCMLIFLLQGCKDDDHGPSAEEQQTSKLKGTWTIGTLGSVTRNDVTLSGWNNFQLTIGDGSYQTSNVPEAVWRSEGRWQYVAGDVNALQRDDGALLNIILADNSLQIRFQFSASSANGRIDSIDGAYVFNLTKQ